MPPGKSVAVREMGKERGGTGNRAWNLVIPELQLHCGSETCQGVRFFAAQTEAWLRPEERKEQFSTFVCRNCRRSTKTFAFWARLSDDGVNGELMKFGEVPSFGPPTPARVITIIGAERDYFLKGRRSENQGLGIAAFAYYRRVVENQRARIFEEVIRVSEKIGASPEQIADLHAAKAETQFSRAVDAIKHGIPQVLLIDGHNPMSLLHAALSEGLHAQTDEQCLELATSIRVVLTELVERMAIALKEEGELKSAVSRLLQVSAQKSKPA